MLLDGYLLKMALKSLKKAKDTIVGEHKQEKIWPQVVAIAIATLSSLSYGLMFTWTSPYILKISKDKTNYDISEKEAAYLTIIPPIVMMSACLFFSKLNDMFGRKTTLMFIVVPYIVFWVLTIVAKDIEIFYVARFFTGLGDAIYFVSLPMYVAEISIPKVRGTWGNLVMVMMFTGVFLMNVIGSYVGVKEVAYICLPILFIFLLLMLTLPESPYFYVMKGQEEEAKKSLKFLRAKENVDDEYVQLKTAVKRQISERGTWMDLFKIRANRRALIAGVFLRFSQLMSGPLVFTNFAHFIFNKAGTNISSEVSSMLFSGLMLTTTICCAYTVEKFGRRKNYIFSLLGCGIVLMTLAVYFFLDQNMKVDMTYVQWFPLVGMLAYIISMSIGVGIIPPLMLGELFSTSIKTKALTFTVVITGLIQFVTSHIFYELYAKCGLFAPFLMFSISCFVSTLLSVKIIPETKGKTLEEIQQLLRS